MFDLTIEEAAGTVTLSLTGELDISTGERLQTDLSRIEMDSPSTIIVDLQGLEFMDSTGLRILIAADTRARSAGRRLVLVRGRDTVQRVFQATRLDERFEFVDPPGALTA
ncbi:MAG: STAS domain-containing protein [Thermoleophilaceae bacterium]